MTDAIWEDVDVLIPRHLRRRRAAALAETRRDIAALIAALPSAEPDDALMHLGEADPDECRAWITRVIRALPIRADTEAAHGVD